MELYVGLRNFKISSNWSAIFLNQKVLGKSCWLINFKGSIAELFFKKKLNTPKSQKWKKSWTGSVILSLKKVKKSWNNLLIKSKYVGVQRLALENSSGASVNWAVWMFAPKSLPFSDYMKNRWFWLCFAANMEPQKLSIFWLHGNSVILTVLLLL